MAHVTQPKRIALKILSAASAAALPGDGDAFGDQRIPEPGKRLAGLSDLSYR